MYSFGIVGLGEKFLQITETSQEQLIAIQKKPLRKRQRTPRKRKKKRKTPPTISRKLPKKKK
jgi:hypothetical protein